MVEDKDRFRIAHVHAREILDGTGCPTVEAEVWTRGGICGVGSAPSGTSTGTHEARELRDGDERYSGKGVRKAVANVVSRIAPALEGMDVRGQGAVDGVMIEMDGTDRKENLGGNAVLAVSVAVLKAAARATGHPVYRHLGGLGCVRLPVPAATVISGGPHSGSAMDFEDFLVVPDGLPDFASAVRALAEITGEIGNLLASRYGSVPMAGTGYAPHGMDNGEALAVMVEAIGRCGYEGRCSVGLDVAASNFYDAETGMYSFSGRTITARDLMDVYGELLASYPFSILEDPFDEEDFSSFSKLTERSSGTLIVGDDLFVSSSARLAEGISCGAANTILLKINQIGTLTEALDTALLARESGYRIMASARSRESLDEIIADVAVGVGAGYVKLGAPNRGERISKFNRLLRIEEELGPRALYGTGYFPGKRISR